MQHAIANLTPEDFCMAFLTALGRRGATVIDVRSAETSRGFAAALSALDDKIKEFLAGEGDWQAAVNLLKTHSYLSPSIIGSFDRFETCLRSLQTSVVSSDNPELRDMHSEITEPFASATLNDYGSGVGDLAEEAANRFLSAMVASTT